MFNTGPSVGTFHKSDPLSAAAVEVVLPALSEAIIDEARMALACDEVDNGTPVEWTDEAILRLHFMLLDDCEKLADPETPLDERLDILRWMYTEPEKDDAPFSFANCLKLFGRATNPTQVPFDVQEIRQDLHTILLCWLRDNLKRYPAWVREAFDSNPDHVSELLDKDPQCINKEVRMRVAQGDLFAKGHMSTSTLPEGQP